MRTLGSLVYGMGIAYEDCLDIPQGSGAILKSEEYKETTIGYTIGYIPLISMVVQRLCNTTVRLVAFEMSFGTCVHGPCT